MRNNLHLNLLYNFVESKDANGNTVSYYKVLYLFSDIGPVAENTLKSIYNHFEHRDYFDGFSFNSLDDLGSFAVEVCKDLSAPEIFILSAQDYNIGLDSCNDVRSFREVFRRYGTVIENPEGSRRPKNIFGKLFDS